MEPFKGASPPTGLDYILGEKPITVQYAEIADKFEPKEKVQPGVLVCDVTKKMVGKCVRQGFVKGYEGTKITIKPIGSRRHHFADPAHVVALPAAFSFVRDTEKDIWYKMATMNSKHAAKLFQCFKKNPSTTGGDENTAETAAENAAENADGDGEVDTSASVPAAENPTVPAAENAAETADENAAENADGDGGSTVPAPGGWPRANVLDDVCDCCLMTYTFGD